LQYAILVSEISQRHEYY